MKSRRPIPVASEEFPLGITPAELQASMATRLCPYTSWFASHPKEFSALPPKKKAGLSLSEEKTLSVFAGVMGVRDQSTQTLLKAADISLPLPPSPPLSPRLSPSITDESVYPMPVSHPEIYENDYSSQQRTMAQLYFRALSPICAKYGWGCEQVMAAAVDHWYQENEPELQVPISDATLDLLDEMEDADLGLSLDQICYIYRVSGPIPTHYDPDQVDMDSLKTLCDRFGVLPILKRMTGIEP
ncbi:hypothetical protein KIPB_003644 [Kipferlia bialata]|uniref:Uncharacterized protein n=1 Tax=Kipferlia bialata TaxID=797122 RepID=A0A9K3CU09_9EUKA|nr:hypothetical protein KIPB_003644 [Kipferlia bialata]|eukprot:g3644.t1